MALCPAPQTARTPGRPLRQRAGACAGISTGSSTSPPHGVVGRSCPSRRFASDHPVAGHLDTWNRGITGKRQQHRATRHRAGARGQAFPTDGATCSCCDQGRVRICVHKNCRSCLVTPSDPQGVVGCAAGPGQRDRGRRVHSGGFWHRAENRSTRMPIETQFAVRTPFREGRLVGPAAIVCELKGGEPMHTLRQTGLSWRCGGRSAPVSRACRGAFLGYASGFRPLAFQPELCTGGARRNG